MFGIMSQREVMIPQAFSLIFIIILDISLRLTHDKYLWKLHFMCILHWKPLCNLMQSGLSFLRSNYANDAKLAEIWYGVICFCINVKINIFYASVKEAFLIFYNFFDGAAVTFLVIIIYANEKNFTCILWKLFGVVFVLYLLDCSSGRSVVFQFDYNCGSQTGQRRTT